MSSFARRLAITMAVPVALYFVGEHLLLPGVPEDLVDRVGGNRFGVGVLALGVAPILAAYWMVEIAAFLVPRWSRLRHGNPEGRAKLDLAARILAVVFAAFQGFGVAQSMDRLQQDDLMGRGSAITTTSPIVVVTLVGGVCLQFVAARFISQRGLVNGFVVLIGASHLVTLGHSLMEATGLRSPVGIASGRAHAATPRELAFTGVGLVLMAFATWLVVGRPSAPPLPAAGGEGGSAPYRGARQLVCSPWIPLPASSLQAYALAMALLALPATLLRVPGMAGLTNLLERNASVATAIALTVTTVVFARVMHRPAELSDLALRLGAKARGEVEDETRGAARRALNPTLMYFLALALASRVSRIGGVLAVPIVVVAAIEIARSFRTSRPGMVAIWEERRASAVPVLRAALAADGIASEARGMAMLSLFQVFAPYAPAEILVREEDAERATKTLRHWLLGDEAPERAESSEPIVGTRASETPWPAARRNMMLGGSVAAALLAVALFHTTSPSPSVPTGPRPKLEIVRVDDTHDPLDLPEDQIPVGEGIDIRYESAPVGRGERRKVHFARLDLREGESKAAATARFRRWLSTITLPPDARFGIEEIVDYDDDANTSMVKGLRTFVLVGESAIRTDDVTDAAVVQSPGSEEVIVTVTFSEEAGDRFEELTGEWTERRIAIVVDDEVNSAPIVKTRIAGGNVSIAMGAGERNYAKAAAFAARLRGF